MKEQLPLVNKVVFFYEDGRYECMDFEKFMDSFIPIIRESWEKVMNKRFMTERVVPENFEKIINEQFVFESKNEANMVLDSLIDIWKDYGVTSMADLYDLSNVYSDNYILEDYGWKDLAGSKVVKNDYGYILDLPKVKRIDQIHFKKGDTK